MGLLNDVKGTEVARDAAVQDSKAERKAKSKERKAAKAEAIKRIYEYLVAHPIKELEKDVEALKPSERTGFAVSAFLPETIFGDGYKKGAKVTALEVFTKHRKGYPEMRKYIKKWAEKGVKVRLDADTQSYIVD